MFEEEIRFGKLLLKTIRMLPRMDVLTKFVEGRSRVIDRKRKGYRWTDRPTDMCQAICPLFFEGGHNYLW